jgi:hypothetical protein
MLAPAATPDLLLEPIVYCGARSIMSVTRVGATKKFADNWEHIFGGRKKKVTGGKAAGESAKKSAKKKLTAKLSGKKRPAKKKARRQAR